MAREKEKKSKTGAELKHLVLYFIVLVFVFSRIFVSTPMPVGHTILSLLVFGLLTAAFLLAFNPPLIKEYAGRSNEARIRFGFSAVLLFAAVTVIFAALTGQFSLIFIFIVLLYSLVPISIAALFIHQPLKCHWLEAVVLFALWTLLYGGVIRGVTIPPVQGQLQVLWLIFILSVIAAYAIIRVPGLQGLVFHFKGSDWRTVIHFTMIGILFLLIVGFASKSLLPSTFRPHFSGIVFGFVSFYFLTALPEEVFFRGFFYHLYEKHFEKSGLWVPVASSALLYGLLHAWQPNPVHIGLGAGFDGLRVSVINVILATGVGAVYTLVFIKTRKVTAAALTHALIGWCWAVFFAG